MIDRIAIILAAGQSLRWGGDASTRHFISIWDEPLIKRLLRQLNELEIPAVVMGNTKPLLELKPSLNPMGKTKASSLVRHRELWKDRTIAICGDVVFLDSAIKQISECNEPIAFFGTGSELFAMTFSQEKHEEIASHLARAHKYGGNLWNVYRSVIGVKPDKHVKEDVFLHYISDGVTRDFDHTSSYRGFCKEFPVKV